MKKAFVLSVSRGYLPGLISFLNAHKYYGHNEDIHVLLYEDILDSDLKILLENFFFNYQFNKVLRDKYPVKCNPRTQRGWHNRFYKYIWAANHIDADIFCFWGGDVLLLNNISQYINLGEHYIVCGNSHNYSRFYKTLNSPVEEEMASAVSDIPLMTSDKDFLMQIWEEAQNVDIRMMGRAELRCLHNAICKMGMVKKLFLVPYAQWVKDTMLHAYKIRHSEGNYFRYDGSLFYGAHGPFWQPGFIIKKARANSTREYNLNIFYEIYKKTGFLDGISNKGIYREKSK